MQFHITNTSMLFKKSWHYHHKYHGGKFFNNIKEILKSDWAWGPYLLKKILKYNILSVCLPSCFDTILLVHRTPWCHFCGRWLGRDHHVARHALPPNWYRDDCTALTPQDLWMVKDAYLLLSSGYTSFNLKKHTLTMSTYLHKVDQSLPMLPRRISSWHINK